MPYLFELLLKSKNVLLVLLLELLLLLTELLSELLFLISELLSKYVLKGMESSLGGIGRVLNCLNELLVDSSRSINRGRTHSRPSSRLDSLRRLRILHLFVDRPLN